MIRVLMLLVILITSAGAVASAAEGGPSVGVLYLEQAIEKSHMHQRKLVEVAKRLRQARQQIELKQGELNALRSRLDLTPGNDPAAFDIKEQIELKSLETKMFIERKQGEINAIRTAHLRDSFEHLRTKLAAFCEQEGISMVFRAPEPEMRSKRLEDSYAELASHSLLYHNASLDITEAFIAFMNEGEALPEESAEEILDAPSAPAIDLGADDK